MSRKISFTNLVNNFESNISKSKLPNTSLSSKSKLVLSTPTKRARGLHIDIESESKVICLSQIADNWSELNHEGRGDGESPAKRGKFDRNSGGSVQLERKWREKTSLRLEL